MNRLPIRGPVDRRRKTRGEEQRGGRKVIDESKLGLLAVWNPIVKPETIAAHVESLRHAPPDRAWTWWGRVYAGSKNIRDVLPTVTHERLTRDVSRVLYVTNFSSLHALHIDAIHLGELSELERSQTPTYYRETNHAIPLWFRVRDVRVVHWQQGPTLAALAEMAEVALKGDRFERSSFGKVDPYASHRWDWPVLVDAPDVKALFPPGQTFFQRKETVAPQAIHASIDDLSRAHPVLWESLDQGSQLALASAEMVHRMGRNQAHFDAATAAIGLTRALEIELCRRLLVETVIPALRVRHGLDEQRLCAQLFANGEPRAWYTKRTPPPLGDTVIALGNLRDRARAVDWKGLLTLSDPADRERIEAARDLRNDVTHGRGVALAQVEALFRELWGDSPLFQRILDARSEIG